MRTYLQRVDADLTRRYGADYELLDIEVARDTDGELQCTGSVEHEGAILIFGYGPRDERIASNVRAMIH